MKKMRFLLYFLLLPAITGMSFAQYTKITNTNNTPPEQINKYLEYAEKYKETDIDSFKFYLKKVITVSNRHGIATRNILKAYYLYGKLFYTENNTDSAFKYIKKSIEIAEKIKNDTFSAKSYRITGNLYYNKNDFNKSLKEFEKAMFYAEKIKDSILIVDISVDKAYSHEILSENDSTLHLLENAYDISEKINYEEGVGKSSLAIGNIYYSTNVFNKALKYYQKALDAAKASNSIVGIATSYKNIGTVYLEQEKYEEAENYLLRALEKYKETGNPYFLSNVYNDLAVIYSKKNEYETAVDYLNKSVSILKKYGSKEDVAIALNVSAEVYKNFKEYNLSNKYLDTCIAIADEIKFGLMLQRSYKTYSENLIALKKYEKAINYLKKSYEVKDSLLSEKFNNKLAEFEAKYKTAQKEKEIIKLKDRELLEEAYKNLLLTGIISLTIIFGLIIFRIQTKRKKDSEIQRQKALIRLKETELIKAKLKQKEAEEKKLKDEIEFKTKQLTAHALNMMQKNKLLKELGESITEQSKKSNPETRKELNKIKRQLENGLNADKDWDLFKKYFEQINESFFDKLKSLNPKLTSNDYKLSALCKLNMSLKETASVLNISPDSVKNARYRLKKKLRLKEDESLSDFIRNL